MVNILLTILAAGGGEGENGRGGEKTGIMSY
jgi:hypothetical protein